MKVDTIKMSGIIINGFLVTQVNGSCNFCMSNKDFSIMFKAEYREGMYFSIDRVYDKAKNKFYISSRFTKKHLTKTSEIAHKLLLQNYIWDYKNQCPALESYAWDIKPYVEKCINLGIAY